MKILLLMPNANIHRIQFGSFAMSLREAPLITSIGNLVYRRYLKKLKIDSNRIFTEVAL
jgi:hypothetical protein